MIASFPARAIASIETPVLWIKRLLTIYFVLWVLEGALRKWVVPQLSDALLLIRDPLLLIVYGLAAFNGFFPRNRTLYAAALLCVLCTFTGFLVLPEFPSVILFGVRTDFLFLPLVYLIPKVWNRGDVERLGNLALSLSVPMAALMLMQFLATPDSLINAGAGGSISGQISTSRGHIRPPGTFSYISGPNCLYALTTAFVLNAMLSKSKTKPPLWLIASATIALIVATVASGSRSQLLSVGCVVAVGVGVVATLNLRLFFRLTGALAALVIAASLAAQFSFFAEGTATLAERLQGGETTMGAGLANGLALRTLNGFTNSFDRWSEAPPFGEGLGLGTNVAGKLLTGKAGWVIDSEEDGAGLFGERAGIRRRFLVVANVPYFILVHRGYSRCQSL